MLRTGYVVCYTPRRWTHTCHETVPHHRSHGGSGVGDDVLHLLLQLRFFRCERTQGRWTMPFSLGERSMDRPAASTLCSCRPPVRYIQGVPSGLPGWECNESRRDVVDTRRLLRSRSPSPPAICCAADSKMASKSVLVCPPRVQALSHGSLRGDVCAAVCTTSEHQRIDAREPYRSAIILNSSPRRGPRRGAAPVRTAPPLLARGSLAPTAGHQPGRRQASASQRYWGRVERGGKVGWPRIERVATCGPPVVASKDQSLRTK